MLSFGLLCAALAGASAGVVVPGLRYTNGWALTNDVIPVGTNVKFTIAVKEQGLEEIKRIAKEVSNPTHAKYGEYLSTAEIERITKPDAEDVKKVVAWLDAVGASYKFRTSSNIEVDAPVRVAQELLETKFHIAKHSGDEYAVIRAGDYKIPDEVYGSIATIFGLHGLPLPKAQAKSAMPGEPVDVTPAVIYQTYGVTKQPVRRSKDNRQAVAEFQGQFMNSTDLVNMFKRYVTGYEAGTDDKVTVWHGEHEENSGGIEAELDIQYIMATAPGIQTEFWEFPGQDFGADLNMWTSNLTTGDDVPLVHSVSYGWQGNLSQIGVKMSDVAVVDANFAKLAAKGISIMISSGDSGSGYAEEDPCEMGGEKSVGIKGDVITSMRSMGYSECCDQANQHEAKGWQFAEWPKTVKNSTQAPEVTTTKTMVVAAPPPSSGTITFKKSIYHVEVVNPQKPIMKTRQLFSLTGKVTAKAGGVVKATSLNGTLGTVDLTFSGAYSAGNPGPVSLYNVSGRFGAITLHARAEAIDFPGQPAELAVFEWNCPGSKMPNNLCYIWEHGPNPPPPPPPPPPGTCTIFSTVESKMPANSTTESGFAKKTSVTLWASWPASSPWVTAVGATRFEGQKVGNPEMATDQFGSGGGFYPLFTTDAEFQAAAVKKYLNTVDPSTLPPADSFDATARATPDVAALGEGFQVIVDGQPQSVGGTSASSPTFAGLVSLLNEARMTAGKKPMGFLNQFLYQNEDAFFDVTAGSNKIGRGGQPLPYGFNCSAGWDPATGLGTPLFAKLLKAAMNN